jgi:hypothetical protein
MPGERGIPATCSGGVAPPFPVSQYGVKLASERLHRGSPTTASEAKILDAYDPDFGYDAETFRPRQPVHWLWIQDFRPQRAAVPWDGKAGWTIESW